MITIIDYGIGNIGSIANMFKKLGYFPEITSDSLKIKVATKIILPGVGSFDRAICNIDDLGLIAALKEKVLDEKIPILGICLGMQLMCMKSEEGVRSGLGMIDAEVKKFRFNENDLKVPHMGWNTISPQKHSPLLDDTHSELRFYFVHSYHVVCRNQEDVLTTTDHGYQFVSSFERDNIIGVQFHPEKSHKFGMQLLKNFIENY